MHDLPDLLWAGFCYLLLAHASTACDGAVKGFLMILQACLQVGLIGFEAAIGVGRKLLETAIEVAGEWLKARIASKSSKDGN